MVLVARCFWAPRGRSCARREALGRWGFSRCARGRRVIASSACPGPAPLPLRLGMCRGRFGDRLLGGGLGTGYLGLSLLHKRCHSIPSSLDARLRCLDGSGRPLLLGSAGPVLRSQGSSGEVGLFALCAREKGDRFQCLPRPGPAAASAGYVPWVIGGTGCGGRIVRGWGFPLGGQ